MSEDTPLLDSPLSSVKSINSSSIADIIDGSKKTMTLTRRNSLRRSGGSIGIMNSKLTEALKDAEVVKSEDEDHVNKFRITLQKFMSASTFGMYYENVFLLMSIFSCCEYIYELYLNDSDQRQREELAVLHIAELVLAVLFTFDWMLCFFMADHKLIFCTSFYSMVDLFTVIPIFVNYRGTQPDVVTVYTFSEGLIYSLYALNTTRILRVLRIRRKLLQIEDAVERYIKEVLLAISIMILFFAAAIKFVEYPYQIHDYHTWIYYIIVTVATVGYGDIHPLSTQGRIAAMCIIGFSIISIPYMTNQLLEKMALQSVYARAVYLPLSKRTKHVIICGDISSTSMKEFFAELFHEDHETTTELIAILLLPIPPTLELIILMKDSPYSLQIHYLEGSALNSRDLRRAKPDEADAVFIMTNKFSTAPDEDDANTILLSLSIKRYIASFGVEPKQFCMQLVRPQNRKHLPTHSDEGSDQSSKDLLVCINEIKMGVLAKGLMYPGANTMLMNLLCSFSGDADESDADGDGEEQMEIIDPEDGSTYIAKSNMWLREYQKGCDWEIYTTALSPVFKGFKFCDLSYALYLKLGVVLFAIQVTENQFANSTRLLLNPSSFIIPDQEQFTLQAFVLAPDQEHSDMSFPHATSASDWDATSSLIKPTFAEARASQLVHLSTNLGEWGSNIRRSSTFHLHSDMAARLRLQVHPMADSSSSSISSADQQRAKKKATATVTSLSTAKKTPSLWKKLKRSALLKQKVATFSFEEVKQKIEDEHMMGNYYLRKKPIELCDILIRTSVVDEVPFINEHLIIIGKNMSTLLDLIRPLRAKHLGTIRYIVILSPDNLPEEIWTRIAHFEAILFVRGSSLDEKHLRRAGIFRASKVLVLADGTDTHKNSNNNNNNSNNSSSSGLAALVDSDAIFTYQSVKRIRPDAHIIVEIVNTSNINYLRDDDDTVNDDYKFTTQFAAGSLFTTTLLDSIVCQAYYNTNIIKVLNKLLAGIDQIEPTEVVKKAKERCSRDADDDANRRDDDASLPLEQESNERAASLHKHHPVSKGTSKKSLLAPVLPKKKVKKKKKTADGDSSSSSSSSDDASDSDQFDADAESDDKTVARNKKSVVHQTAASVSAKQNFRQRLMSAANAATAANNSSSSLSQVQGSCLYQLELQDSLYRVASYPTYGSLFKKLSSEGIIPLGLLRGVFNGCSLGPTGNKSPYVFTNPDKDTPLYKYDKVFVLSTKPILSTKKLGLKDWLLKKQMEKDKGSSLLVPSSSGAASSSLSKSSDVVDYGLQLMQKKVDARISKMSCNFVKQVGHVFELIDHCMQNTGLFGEVHPRRYSIESLSSAETGNVHDINSPEPSNSISGSSYPYMYARPPVGSSPVGILRKKSLPGEDGRDYGLAGSPKKKKQSFSGMIETIVENPRSAEKSTLKDGVMDDRYDGLRYVATTTTTTTTTAATTTATTVTERVNDDEGSSFDQRVRNNINDSDIMTISD